jgi:superfamily I DNA/RNA helicase/Zn-dependent peptidase ImmA (M78 family)
MDAFEKIRLAAEALHEKLVAKGFDPDKPLDFVKAGAADKDIEVSWLKEGDPALKGARALFDEQAGLICSVDKGTDGERACLIAHELGHVHIHAGSSECTSEDIDPTRSIEAAPVGLQRVEDYGARERRELQANVFAREFLLPRSRARQKHLAGAGATQLAIALGLPKNLIRQQLLDALLLPPVPPEKVNAPETPSRDDPSQHRAAQHRGSAFQLQAGPGTGKTRTLVKRVLSSLSDGVDPASILVLTFSNRAAGELAERLMAVVPDTAARLWIGTFHAFGLDLMRRYHDKFDLPTAPSLFDRSDAIEVLEEVLPTLQLDHYRNLWDPTVVLKDIVGTIGRAKDEIVDEVEFRRLAQAMKDVAVGEEQHEAADKALEIAQVYEIYQRALRARRSVDFGDLIMRPTILMNTDEGVRATVRLRHRHVLVDEYQDVNRASALLLKAIVGDGERLWVVGDARQSIYRFRGASSVNMVRFAEEYPNVVIDRLSINYRSSEEVIRAYSAVAPHMGASRGMLPLELIPAKGPSNIKPELRCFGTQDEEAAGIAASVRELEQSGVALRDQAVLCHTNKRLNEIAQALEVRGIPVLHLGSLFERHEVRDLLALLSLAIDPFGDGLARVAAMPRYNVPLQDIRVVVHLLRERPGAAAKKLATVVGEAALSDDGRAGLTRLAADLDGLSSSSSPWDVLLTYLLDHTALLADLSRKESIQDRMRAVALWQFLNFVRDPGPPLAGSPIQRVLDRVRQLVLLAEERDLRQIPAAALHMDAVRLMTVHGSKGLEFDAVHIPGLTLTSFPTSYHGERCPPPAGMIEDADHVAEHEMEEECLFFVALSRARLHLRLYRSPAGRSSKPSPFLDWFANGEVVTVPDPRVTPLPADAPKPAAIAIIWPEDWNVTDSRLRHYESCPRRFFYTYVLGLGGARKTTAFSQTHDCLYGIIDWLTDARAGSTPGYAEAAQEFERVWAEKGPVTHGFAADYRRLADRLVRALVDAGAGRTFRASERLAIDLAGGRVIVEPDEIAELPNGTVILRRVRTGRRRDKEYDELDYTLYHLAGRAHYGSAYVVEAIHLTSEIVEPVTGLTPTKLKNRQAKAGEMLNDIAAGWFPPKPNDFRCPRCPHFFVCDAVARGSLSLR